MNPLACASFLRSTVLSKPCRFLLLIIIIIIDCPVYAQNSSGAKRMFASRCALCHGTDARGGEYGPALAGNDDLLGKPISWFRNVIQNGVPSRGMPAFHLDGAELNALAALIHSFNVPAAESTLP